MLKGNDLVGKPILIYNTGEMIETVERLVYDFHFNQVVAFVVERRVPYAAAPRSDLVVLPWSGVYATRSDAIMTWSRQMVVDAWQLFQINQVLERDTLQIGTHFQTTTGRDLGRLIDIYFDARTGCIEGYEVAGGQFADPDTNRSFIPRPQIIRVENQIALLPAATADQMQERSRGSKQLTQVSDEARHKVFKAAENQSIEMPQRALDDLADQSRRTEKDRDLVEQLKGKRVRRDVRTDSGYLIAVVGQIINDKVLECTRVHHKERELWAAVWSDAPPSYAYAGGE
ncbi:MAG: hypothetical protein GXY36_15805 [Chloroflexi bacterium]|nr:hypothetical protein [Chloroflexota bacterium]